MHVPVSKVRMTARQQLVQWVEGSSGFDDAKVDKAVEAIGSFTDARCATYMAASVERRLKLLNAVTAEAPPAAGNDPVTITIYDPEETPDVYTMTFKNEEKFEKFLTRGSIMCLFKDGVEPCIDDFNALTPGGYYTFELRKIPDGVRNLEQHKAQIISRREQEFACAIVEDLFDNEGIEAVQLADERVVRDQQGNDVAAVDVVVGYADGTGYIVGSMQSYVSSVADVNRLVKKIHEQYEKRAPFAGKPIQPAFMLESVKPGLFPQLKAICHDKRVRLYTRNGRSISRVQMRASMCRLAL